MTAPFGDGGPAFPNRHQDDGRGNVIQYSDAGMTLRDYFAAKAMQGVHAEYLKAAVDRSLLRTDYQDMAADAYTLADAMLKARQV